jgi:hypothetical protein
MDCALLARIKSLTSCRCLLRETESQLWPCTHCTSPPPHRPPQPNAPAPAAAPATAGAIGTAASKGDADAIANSLANSYEGGRGPQHRACCVRRQVHSPPCPRSGRACC